MKPELDLDALPRCCAHPSRIRQTHPSVEVRRERVLCIRCGTAGAWCPSFAETTIDQLEENWETAVHEKGAPIR